MRSVAHKPQATQPRRSAHTPASSRVPCGSCWTGQAPEPGPRTHGHHAVQRLHQADADGRQDRTLLGQVQPQWTVSLPGDRYEQEAERMAKRVMSMAPPTTPTPRMALREVLAPEAPVQTQCAAGQEATGQHSTAGAAAATPSATVQRLQSRAGSGRPLPAAVRAFMEPRFRTDFSQVQVHTDHEAARMNRALQAHAFTYRHYIYFGAGKAPGINELTAHELTHVVQQTHISPGAPAHLNATIQRMLACPPRLTARDPVPTGWKPYQGDATVFHCGFRGILEDRAPTANDLQNECFYDHSGRLVDEQHPYAGCRGTPNRYDSRLLAGVPHATIDPGGIVRAGGPAFITSRVYSLTSAISAAIQIVSTAGRVAGSIVDALGEAIALGVLTAVASVAPENWRFQDVPARSVRHLNMVGAILGSTTLSRNADTLLRNLTRRLESFPIAGLLDEIAQDINQALQARGVARQRVTASILGGLSLLQLVGWLHENGMLSYLRPPGEIAREQLAAQRAATP